MTFNEKEFIEFLESDTNKPFPIYESKRSYENKFYSAIRVHEDYSILIDFNPTHLNNLVKIYKSQREFELEAIYFNKINTIVYENSYDKKKLENKCEEIKIYDFPEIYTKIYDLINKEFQNREIYLREAFKNEREKIEELKENTKNNAFRILIGKDVNSYQLFSDYAFNDLKNRQMAYEYLINPNQYIQTFVDDFLKNDENLNLIKHIICRQIAIDELMNELKDDPYIHKAKYILELLKNELNGAKKIWVKTNDGMETQIENMIGCFEMNNVVVGGFWEKIDIEKIVGFKYSRKYYEVLS